MNVVVYYSFFCTTRHLSVMLRSALSRMAAPPPRPLPGADNVSVAALAQGDLYHLIDRDHVPLLAAPSPSLCLNTHILAVPSAPPNLAARQQGGPWCSSSHDH